MLVLGGNAAGGIHGVWPGLDSAQLFEGADVDVTTDYRRVLSDVLIRRLENPMLGTVFPDYTGYAPLGVVQGVDLPPDSGGLKLSFDGTLRFGQPAGAVVVGADPGETVEFYASTVGAGEGPCLPTNPGLCLGLEPRVLLAGTAPADGAGVARLDIPVPSGPKPLSDVWVQAVARRGTNQVDSVVSNVVRTKIYP